MHELFFSYFFSTWLIITIAYVTMLKVSVTLMIYHLPVFVYYWVYESIWRKQQIMQSKRKKDRWRTTHLPVTTRHVLLNEHFPLLVWVIKHKSLLHVLSFWRRNSRKTCRCCDIEQFLLQYLFFISTIALWYRLGIETLSILWITFMQCYITKYM